MECYKDIVVMKESDIKTKKASKGKKKVKRHKTSNIC